MIANDLSPSAVETIRRNVELNNLGPQALDQMDDCNNQDNRRDREAIEHNNSTKEEMVAFKKSSPHSKVVVNEDDAWYVSH